MTAEYPAHGETTLAGREFTVGRPYPRNLERLCLAGLIILAVYAGEHIWTTQPGAMRFAVCALLPAVMVAAEICGRIINRLHNDG